MAEVRYSLCREERTRKLLPLDVSKVEGVMKKIVVLSALVALVVLLIIILPGDGPPADPVPEPAETVPGPVFPPLAEPGKPAPEPEQPLSPEVVGPVIVLTVVDVEGNPLQGAEAGVWDAAGYFDAKTDEHGVARLIGLEPGRYQAYAVADGFAGDEQYEVVLPEDADLELRFALDAGVPYEGRIVDALDGRPVPGAFITVTAGGTVAGYSEILSRAPYDRLWGDDEGRFRVRGIPPAAVGTLVVEAPGYQTARVSVRAPSDATAPPPVTVELEPGGTVSGTVSTPDGKPLPGAVVYVVPAHAETLRENPHVTSSGSGGLLQALTARAGADGNYEVSGLTLDGAYVAMAEADGYARSAESIELRPTREVPALIADLTVRRPGTLVLTVLDENGVPVEDVYCHLGGFLSGHNKNRPDAPGLFRFEGLSPGNHIAHFGSMRFVDIEVECEVRPGKTTEKTVKLDPGAIISGILVDGAGKPVPDAHVSTTRLDGSVNTSDNSSATTDQEGRFELRGLKAGGFKLSARITGFSVIEEITVDAPIFDVRLVGEWLGKARIAFKSPDGSPLPDRVFLWRWKGGGGSGSGADVVDGGIQLDGFDGIPETLDVRFDGFIPVKREVTIRPGEDVDLGVVTLDPGVTLPGVVRDPAGDPVFGAEVSWDGPSTAVAGEDGRFVLEHVPPGKIRLSADADGFLNFEEEVDPAKGEVVIVLLRGAILTATLRNSEGVPLSAVWIRFRREIDGKFEFEDAESTDEAGLVRLRLPSGRYLVECDGGEEAVSLGELELKEGETREVGFVRGE
jgi:Carboxypeptidase regulatory-like domain